MRMNNSEINNIQELQFISILQALDTAAEVLEKGIADYSDKPMDLIVHTAITHDLSFPFRRAMAKSLYKDDKTKCLAVNDFISILEDKYKNFEEKEDK